MAEMILQEPAKPAARKCSQKKMHTKSICGRLPELGKILSVIRFRPNTVKLRRRRKEEKGKGK